MTDYYLLAPNLGVSVCAKYRVYLNYFRKEYSFASVKKTLPSVELKIVNNLPKSSGPYLVRRLINFKKLFWFEYLIDFSQEKTVIWIKHHPVVFLYAKAFLPFIQTNCLEPVLYYLCLGKGLYFLHASTVSQNGLATCFVGAGGAGKTKTALNYCLKNQFAFLGDDLIFVDSQTQTVYCFPRPLHLFSYNIKVIPAPQGLRNKVFFYRLKLLIRFKDGLRFIIQLITKNRPLISTRVEVAALYPQIKMEKQATLKEIRPLTKVGKSELLNYILEASDLRADLMTMIKDLPKKERAEFEQKEAMVLTTILKKV